MSFWSDLFSKKNKVEEIDSPNNQLPSSIEDSLVKKDDRDYQNLEFDENNCLIYPNGLKLYYLDFNSFNDLHVIEEKLGYYDGEVYYSSHDSKGDIVYFEGIEIRSMWELITNKLLCLVTRNKVVLKKDVIDLIVSSTREERSNFEYDGLENGINTLISLGDAVTGCSSISRQFIERVFNEHCNDSVLDVGKFHFEFKNEKLSHCMYNGYDVFMFSGPRGFIVDDVEDYFEYANKNFRSDSTMKTIINYQAYCKSHIDDDILASDITTEKFAYDSNALCINYIAMAAFYKQCDVEQEMFIQSTDGRYEIVSKKTENGVATTKIRAYHEIFTFTNGHSMPEQSFNVEQKPEATENNSQGYVYVMINPSLPEMVKIGMTTKDPNERAKELSAATGVPTPFILVFYKPFVDCYSTEQRIHQFLEDKGYRVKNNREFFNMPTKLAIDIVQAYYDTEQEELGLQGDYAEDNDDDV